MEGGRGRRWSVMRSYLTVTSSVNLSTRCVRMLRGMVLPPSCLWGGLLFRHAGRVELYARAPPPWEAGKEPRAKEGKGKQKWHATDGNKRRQNKWRGRKHVHEIKQASCKYAGETKKQHHSMALWGNIKYSLLLSFQFTVPQLKKKKKNWIYGNIG